MFEWDKKKNQSNFEKHGLYFDEVSYVMPDNIKVIHVDDRKDYNEPRYNCYGYLFEREVVVTFTIRDTNYRVISFRKCNKKEVRKIF